MKAEPPGKKYGIDGVFLRTYRAFRKSGMKHTQALAATEEKLHAPKERGETRKEKRKNERRKAK